MTHGRGAGGEVRYFLVWLALGTQSWGGGSVVLALIRRAAVDTHHWVTEDEFARDWALVQIAPGINLISFVILVGRRVAGARGVALALAGMLLPSALATVLLTALYARFQNEQAVQAAVRGVLPATVGLSLLTTFQLARAPLRASQKEGRASLAVSIALVAGSVCASALWARLPPLFLLVGAGVVAALFHWSRGNQTPSAPPSEPPA